ncbi:MAG TPA: hypothetical protein VGC19_07060 [Rhodanobacter sp.]
MKNRSPLRNLLAAGMLAALSAAAASAMAAEQAVHVRGVITEVSAGGFTVQTAAGAETISLAADTRITGVVPSSIDAIQPGSFIGSANLTNGTHARAQEVVVFPPAMKGSGLGDYPWDLPAHAGGMTAMTGGTVKSSKMGGGSMMHSAMTNGTVKTAIGSGSRSIVVDYGKGEKTIEVMSNTPVVTFMPSDKSAIVKGAHVFVAGKPGTPVAAATVAVGLDGTVPPM